MSTKNTSGSIYFLGEKSVQTGELSSNVKIGKTYFDRPVRERMVDHQAGNPRIIHELASFEVKNVDEVEIHLQHALAENRISGDWF
tara:strand:- start:4397 stop:4654 length:258 start_codon:yes stop_codon:yes gene_type:complete